MSSKKNTVYICTNCGSSQLRWQGLCPDCNSWNTLQEEMKQDKKNFSNLINADMVGKIHFTSLDADITYAKRINTKIDELDRVLGGGFVPGSATLIGGDPGIGKSTLLLQLVDKLAKNNLKCVYISGEESTSQIALRAQRLKCDNKDVRLLCATNVEMIISAVREEKEVDVIVIDSIQTMFLNNFDSAPGTVSQVRACAHELIKFAKENNIILIIVGHVTKEGQIAGPKILEHMVDCVLYFEGERGHLFRIIRAVKNRFGGINEIGVFEMSDKGLEEISNPSSLFLSERLQKMSGSVIFAGIEGTRPILIEIQSLVVPTSMSNPRRAVVGWDSNRLSMIIAVIASRYGLNLMDKEVYLNIVGGIKISEPAADLAVAASLISAATNTMLPDNSVVFGEIGLGGEIRMVSHVESRIKEASKLGFERILMPFSKKKVINNTSLKLLQLEHIKELSDISKNF